MRPRYIYALAFLAAILLAAQPHAQAQPEPTPQYLPAIARELPAAPATICDGRAPILDEDTGSLSAVRDADGRFLVAAQLRARGSRVYIMQHIGASLSDFTPPLSFAAQPELSPPGPKQGSVALVPSNVVGGKSRLYYTQRVEDSSPSDGPYSIWCLEF